MTVVLDIRTPEPVRAALREKGFSVIPLPPHPALPAPVASHPDMLVFFAPDGVCCTESYLKIADKELRAITEIIQKPIVAVKDEYGNRYPGDILFNAALVGDNLFCLKEHTCPRLLSLKGIKTCAVKQGYAKCSTLPIGSGSLITEDPSIARVAQANGLEVLRIDAHNVCLPGYDTGFLGGASSFAPYQNMKEIYFCGDLNRHQNAESIQQFIVKHGFTPISLSSDPLLDVGTMFFIERNSNNGKRENRAHQ